MFPSLQSHLIGNGGDVPHALRVRRKLVHLFHQIAHHFDVTLRKTFQGQCFLSGQLLLLCYKTLEPKHSLQHVYFKALPFFIFQSLSPPKTMQNVSLCVLTEKGSNSSPSSPCPYSSQTHTLPPSLHQHPAIFTSRTQESQPR